MVKSTMKELVDDLVARNASGKYGEIIKEALAGEYHDFKNKKYTCGKVALFNELGNFPELADIREAVIKGEYDESSDDDDKAMMRAELIEDMGEEKAKIMFKQLGL